jgi:acyl-CoA dehydrogenase
MSRSELDDLDDAVSSIFADHCGPDQLAAAEGRLDRRLWQTLDVAGLLAVGVPESAGGSGGGLAEMAVIARRAGEYAAAVPVTESAIAGWLLAEAGLTLPPGVVTVGTGTVKARQIDGTWQLRGVLPRVAYAGDSDVMVGIADSADGPCAFAVPTVETGLKGGENVAREPRDLVAVDTTVGPEWAARIDPSVVDELLLRGALARALMLAGAAARALALTCDYATLRRQFGRPIASFQAVQHQVAALAGEVAVSQAAAQAAVHACEAGFGQPNATVAVAAAKVRAAQAAGVVSAIAHQVHGAIGMTREHVLRFSTSRLWSWRDEWGSEAEWSEKLARCVITGTEGAWPVIAGS